MHNSLISWLPKGIMKCIKFPPGLLLKPSQLLYVILYMCGLGDYLTTRFQSFHISVSVNIMPHGFLCKPISVLEDLGDDDIALGPHVDVKTCDW